MARRKPPNPDGERWIPEEVAAGGPAAPAEADTARSAKGDADVDEWLVPGAPRPSKPRASKPKRTRAKRPKAAARPKPEKGEQVDKERRHELEQLREEHEGELERMRAEHEGELERVRADHGSELERLRAEHEAELAGLRERLAEAENRAGAGGGEVKYPKSPKRRVKPAVENGGRLDINTVDFEDLRALGLSVTQSARVIATRDAREGFDSLKELDELPDLPSEVVSTLKQRLQV